MIKQYTIHWCNTRQFGNNAMSGNKTRPCVIVSNNINNEKAETIEVVPITGRRKSEQLPIHVLIAVRDTIGTAMIENKTTIDKFDVLGYIRDLKPQERRDIQIALLTQQGFIW